MKLFPQSSGWFPGAVIYGKVFDVSCLLWERQSSQQLADGTEDGVLGSKLRSGDENGEMMDREIGRRDGGGLGESEVGGGGGGGHGACRVYELASLRKGFIGITLILQVPKNTVYNFTWHV